MRCSLIMSTNCDGWPPASDAWTQPDPPASTAGQRAVRDAVNGRIADAQRRSAARRFLSECSKPAGRAGRVSSSGDLTYGQLRRQALALAAALRDNGISAGDTVAVIGPKDRRAGARPAGNPRGRWGLPADQCRPAARARRAHSACRSGQAGPGVWRSAAPLPVPALTIADLLDNAPADRVPARDNRSHRACLRVVHLGLDR